MAGYLPWGLSINFTFDLSWPVCGQNYKPRGPQRYAESVLSFTPSIFYIYIYVYIIPIWGWVKTYYYNILGNKHLLTSYLRLFKGIWLITIIPGHGTSHDQSAWLAPFTRFAGPGPKGLPERRIAAIITTGWWLSHPSEKYESQLGWWHSNIWKNVPNHQPDDGMMNIWWALNGN